MADTEISALPASTTPLAGTETLPIAQSGATKKVSVAGLTAGRDVDMAKAKPTDNVVMVAGKGIDFSANGGNVLTHYDEDTWTATLTGSTAAPTTPVTVTGTYTRIGRQVTVQARFYNVNTTGATGDAIVTGLPFTPSAEWFVGSVTQSNISATPSTVQTAGASTTLYLTTVAGGNGVPINAGAGQYLFLTLTYFI